MKLRKLEIKDAELMLEWMHDEDVVAKLGTNFKEKTIQDCIEFIEGSIEDKGNMHLAIADDNDIYMGTVSLKHIDKNNGTAEFAITVRSCAMGKGYSRFGMHEILNQGLKVLQLKHIYWCVSKENERAIRFYDKNGYIRQSHIPANIKEHYTDKQLQDFLWYEVH